MSDSENRDITYQELQIKSGEYQIHGRCIGPYEAKKLIICVHGLTSNTCEHLHFNAAEFFSSRGYAVFLFDFYPGLPKSRSLIQSSLETHASDVGAIIDYFANQYEKIYLIGHSLGGPCIIFSEHRGVSAISLWDPSLDIMKHLSDESFTKDEENGRYILHWGLDIPLSQEMVETLFKVAPEMLEHLRAPTKVICAGKGILVEQWKREVHRIVPEYKFEVVGNATHNFIEPGTAAELYAKTLDWFNSF